MGVLALKKANVVLMFRTINSACFRRKLGDSCLVKAYESSNELLAL